MSREKRLDRLFPQFKTVLDRFEEIWIRINACKLSGV